MLWKTSSSLPLRPSTQRCEREWQSSATWHTMETPCSVRCAAEVGLISLPSASVSLLSLSSTNPTLGLPLHPLWPAPLQHLLAFTSATCHSRAHVLPALRNSRPPKRRSKVSHSGTLLHAFLIGRERTTPLQHLARDSEPVPGVAGRPASHHRMLGRATHLAVAPERFHIFILPTHANPCK